MGVCIKLADKNMIFKCFYIFQKSSANTCSRFLLGDSIQRHSILKV